MSRSPATMVASKMTRCRKASLQQMFHGHHRSTTAATASTRLTKNAGESSMVHPFSIRVPPLPGLQPSEIGLVPAFDVRNHLAKWFGAQEIRRVIPKTLDSVPALYQSRVKARGGAVKIDDDQLNSDDEECYGSDGIPSDLESCEDYDDSDDDDSDDDENYARHGK